MFIFKISITNNAEPFFKTISQNPEHVKTFCNDLINHFREVRRKWILYNSQSNLKLYVIYVLL